MYVGVRWLEGQRLQRGRWPMMFLFEPQGLNQSLEAGVGALRLRFEPWGWDLSLEARIWAWRLGFEPRGKGGDGRSNEQTNESPPVFHRTLSPSGPLPKKITWEKSNSVGKNSAVCMTTLDAYGWAGAVIGKVTRGHLGRSHEPELYGRCLRLLEQK